VPAVATQLGQSALLALLRMLHQARLPVTAAATIPACENGCKAKFLTRDDRPIYAFIERDDSTGQAART
jgi:hypothetical protein